MSLMYALIWIIPCGSPLPTWQSVSVVMVFTKAHSSQSLDQHTTAQKTMHNSFHVACNSEGKWQIIVFSRTLSTSRLFIIWHDSNRNRFRPVCSTSTLSGQPAFFITVEALMNNQLPERSKGYPNAVLQARLS